MIRALRRQMIRAIPTCTLWRFASLNHDTLYLVICPWVRVTKIEMMETQP